MPPCKDFPSSYVEKAHQIPQSIVTEDCYLEGKGTVQQGKESADNGVPGDHA